MYFVSSESSSNVYTVHGLNKHNPRNDNQWNTSSSSKNALYNKTGIEFYSSSKT